MERSERLLPTVCLCAIVKNEESNHAGGIRRYLERIVPHVAQAFVLDTGSTDGTLGILRAAADEWPWLRVAEGPFHGFAEARNHSLDLCLSALAPQCSHILLLDADEYMDEYNLRALSAAVAGLGVDFDFETVECALPLASPLAACDDDDAGIFADAQPIDSTRKCCIALHIVCVDSSDAPIHRASSGLLNPRVFPASSRLRFTNAVGRRFERLVLLPADAASGSVDDRVLTAHIERRTRIEFRHAISATVRDRSRKNAQYRRMDESAED